MDGRMSEHDIVSDYRPRHIDADVVVEVEAVGGVIIDHVGDEPVPVALGLDSVVIDIA